MKASVFAALIALVALAGMAQTPSGAPASPAVVQSPATAASAPAGAVFAANRQAPPKSTCIASCGSSTVSCSGTTCSAVDRNCGAFERGHATCTTGGSTTTVTCAASCNCESLCVCGVPCSTECVVGAFVQECGSWGICATSCACGGECLQKGPRPQKPDTIRGGSGTSCASVTPDDELLAKIFR